MTPEPVETFSVATFNKKPTADANAPTPVQSIQFKKGMTFEERYQLLKFIRGISVTIYAENLVFITAQGEMKVSYDDWIVKHGENWYFVGPQLFAETYEVNP